MNPYIIVSLILFTIWYFRYRFSDDLSAIESFQSAESITDEPTKQEAVRKSEKY